MVTARFYDGKSAKPHSVHFVVGAADVAGKDADGRIVFSWKLARIHVLQPPEDGLDAILMSLDVPDARLHLPAHLYDALKPRLRKQSLPRVQVPLSSSLLLGTGIAAIALIVAIVWIVPIFAPSIALSVPPSWERKLGDYVVNTITEKYPLCTEAEGRKSLDKMVDRLRVSEHFPADIQIDVARMPQVNAFAAPGNRVVILSGLIKEAESAEEVAGVLAHEIGHTVHHHPMEGAVRGAGTQLLFHVMLGSNAGAPSEISGLVLTLSESKHSRDAESKADATGISFLQQAKIDPKPFQKFFERLAKDELIDTGGMLNYFESHPHPLERAKAIAALPAGKYDPLLTKAEWKALKAICGPSKKDAAKKEMGIPPELKHD